MSDDRQCDRITHGGTISQQISNRAYFAPHQCRRKAVYTDGKYCYCAQHAKEPATVMRKASGRIRAGLRKLDEAPGAGAVGEVTR